MKEVVKEIKTALDEKREYGCIKYILTDMRADVTNSELRKLENTIRAYAKRDVNEVLASIIVYCHLKGDEGIDFSRKRGLFAFYIDWNGRDIILSWLLAHREELNISEKMQRYLIHKHKVRWLADFYRESDTQIDGIIKEHDNKKKQYTRNGIALESNIVIELLIISEFIFRMAEGRESNKAYAFELSHELNYNLPQNYTVEEIGAAVSYVISRCTDMIKFGNFLWLDVDAIKNDMDLGKLILIALRRNLVADWEMLIDYYGYDIEAISGGNYRIVDKNDYERSIQLGYIKTRFQEQARNVSHFKSSDKAVCLYQVAEEFGKHPELLFELVEEGTEFERYRMLFYQPLIDFLVPKDYENPTFFMEEYLQLEDAAHELLISAEELLDYKITDLCSVKDIILFKRFFTFVSYTQQIFLKDHQNNMEIIAKSIVPSFRKQELIMLLKFFTGDEKKAEELIDLYCWNRKGILDLQSTPILKLNECQYFLVPFVLTSSNLIRNVIVKERKLQKQNTNSDGVEEPLERYATDLFGYMKDVFSCRQHCSFKYRKELGEVDLVVWSDKHLYLIECKNSILPTSPFELRTTYDYIKKAEKQLDLSKAAITDKDYADTLLGNWGIPIKEYKIHTLILLGNRIFTAPNGFRHPVRYVYELYMVLTSGVINSSFGKWRYWENEEFAETDFIRFISDKDPMSNDFIDSMSPYTMFVNCGKYRIERESYSFNIMKHLELDDTNLANLSTKEHLDLRGEFRKKHDEVLQKLQEVEGS